MLGRLIRAASGWCRRKVIAAAKRRETLLYHGDGSGRDRIGDPVDIDGKTGKVVDGTMLSIVVEWD